VMHVREVVDRDTELQCGGEAAADVDRSS
jgi:hypothetical protein